MEIPTKYVIANCKVYAEETINERGFVLINDGQIADLGKYDDHMNFTNTYVIELDPSFCIVPGMIDLHIHGANGSDAMDATSEALFTIASALPQEGTTSFLATTITQNDEAIEAVLRNVATYMNDENFDGTAELLGVHLEGPFISSKRAGAQPLQFISKPDVELFKKWQRAANGTIKLVTYAPELDIDDVFTKYLKDTGVVPSIGHSDGSYEETMGSIEAGVCHATHLFNQMKGLHHREPGVVGGVLLNREITAELIADGIHVRPEIIQLTFQQKGKDGIILITDAMRAKYLDNGVFDLGGQSVTVQEGKALLEDGTLAGSILKMNDAMKNMMDYTGCSLADVISMTSTNAAKQLHADHRKGSIKKGKDADLVILNDKLEVQMTICRGKFAYQKEGGFV